MTDLETFRRQQDQFFKEHPESPIPQEQRATFGGLRYFPENEALRLVGPVEVYPEQETIEMQTSDGDVRAYQRYGRFDFTVEGQPVSLTVYRDQHSYFLPFVDALAGSETYPAGRYLEPQPLGDGRFLVDFNRAYNPYCAYDEAWSCPMTPFENRLRVPIRAGEKLYHASHEQEA